MNNKKELRLALLVVIVISRQDRLSLALSDCKHPSLLSLERLHLFHAGPCVCKCECKLKTGTVLAKLAADLASDLALVGQPFRTIAREKKQQNPSTTIGPLQVITPNKITFR